MEDPLLYHNNTGTERGTHELGIRSDIWDYIDKNRLRRKKLDSFNDSYLQSIKNKPQRNHEDLVKVPYKKKQHYYVALYFAALYI